MPTDTERERARVMAEKKRLSAHLADEHSVWLTGAQFRRMKIDQMRALDPCLGAEPPLQQPQHYVLPLADAVQGEVVVRRDPTDWKGEARRMADRVAGHVYQNNDDGTRTCVTHDTVVYPDEIGCGGTS